MRKITWLGDDNIIGYKHEIGEEGFYLEEGCLYSVADDPYCGTGPLKINFCPVCGRSIKVVKKVTDLEKDFENNDNLFCHRENS